MSVTVLLDHVITLRDILYWIAAWIAVVMVSLGFVLWKANRGDWN